VATYDYWGTKCLLPWVMKLKGSDANSSARRLLAFHSDRGLHIIWHSGGGSLAGDARWTEHNNDDVVSLFMHRIYGPWAARLVTGLVIVTAFASVSR